MSENKMISISFMDKIVKDVDDTVTIDYCGEELVVKKFLSFTDMVKFINEVVSGCFDDENGVYMPEVKTFLAQINTVLYYSNVRLPEDIKHRFDILTKTDIVDVIIGLIDINQYQTMIRSIEEKIDYRVRTNEQMFNNRMNAALSSIEDMINSIKESFDSVTPDDVRNLVNAISNSSIDEGKLVNAFLTAKDETTAPTEEAIENGEGGMV